MRGEMLQGFSMLQCNFTSFFSARSLNFRCFLKNTLCACLQHVKSHGSLDPPFILKISQFFS